ncbi:histidine phosphatase family protein [Salinimonas sp. HHU 13199]|uniref:Histidine phosphatase family protein n=1 Tax=Salinimonas profundi TaxID=2729140 RepID=A0ABR8LGA7_9ALTE|nr:histidine phosphatase family protein [Salinimonas profundi]MBD3584248.1 histidine phosphatase family protein [Salinimonas profundi]
MTEIYLVRHGQASMGQDNYDVLSALGEQQAQWLADYFDEHEMQFDQLYCGTLQRQIKTIEPVFRTLAAKSASLASPQQLPAFNEFDFMQIIREFLKHNPEYHRDSPTAKYWFRLLKLSMNAWGNNALPYSPETEQWTDFVNRVKAGLSTCTENDPKRVLVVSSGGVIACAVGIVLGLESQQIVQLNLQIQNASITRLFKGREGWSLHSFNALPHMSCASRADKITYA